MCDEPIHTDFMDETLLKCWQGLEKLPGNMRLIGGTAIALYLNHRESIDLDFAADPEKVTPHEIQKQRPFRKIGKMFDITGGLGMVDCALEPHPEAGKNYRIVQVNFLGLDVMMAPAAREPKIASNGVAVAHPVDLCAMKIMAADNRGKLRDYFDLSEASVRWPEHLTEAIKHLDKTGKISEKISEQVLVTPPIEVIKELAVDRIKNLQHFVSGRGSIGLGR